MTKKNFISTTKGKHINGGFQPITKSKLDLLTDSKDVQPLFLFILENLGFHACLGAMDAAPYMYEEFIDKTLRLLALDAAYRTMLLWADTEVSQDGLKEIMRLAHLYAHGEIEYEQLQERLFEKPHPTVIKDKASRHLFAALDARDCALLTASYNLMSSLEKAREALSDHHGCIARSSAYAFKGDQEHALREAWYKGGAISFGAVYGVTSKHTLAAVEAEIWHVSHTIAEELLGFIGYDNIQISEKDMRDFLMESLESAGKDIAHDVMHKGARLVIEAVQAAESFEEARTLALNAAQKFFISSCEYPDLYEYLAIGRVAIAAASYDFDEQETLALCHTLHYLHNGSFYKVHPINAKANEIAEKVALSVRKQLDIEQLVYAAASSYARKCEEDVQAEVLARLLSDA
ncbi:hypothetical protein SYK_32270 [Pseudodesulfovibrio nedwellii]|uniref:Uncharacterized protein n=1 Tax=Pseudodesulfovibrio nedwellii TaxID=2973072 RepID=A0ABM8B4U4_9BACT|nr:hypothetical protein [Pseudodesulfovibrio nedwellii]BDQ38867.1 hypothetical protein SYK_32270 [Pseudodesulfovibrio nedwellii]